MNAKIKSSKKALITGILILIGLTVLSQLISIFNMILAYSTNLSDSVWTYILYTARTLFDSFIYALGAALLIHFTRVSDKRSRTVSYISAILILFVDYSISFFIDLFNNNIIGYEYLTALYLILNILIRAGMYGLLLVFAAKIYNNQGAGELPIPFVSTSHPTNSMMNAAFLVRIMPYVLFEIYSNITGIIEYGFDMTASDVLSIISAYVEILIDGFIVYIVIYLFVVFLSKIKSKE